MQLYDQMLAEHTRLARHIASLESEISKLPEGSLGWQKRGNTYRFYCKMDSKHLHRNP